MGLCQGVTFSLLPSVMHQHSDRAERSQYQNAGEYDEQRQCVCHLVMVRLSASRVCALQRDLAAQTGLGWGGRTPARSCRTSPLNREVLCASGGRITDRLILHYVVARGAPIAGVGEELGDIARRLVTGRAIRRCRNVDGVSRSDWRLAVAAVPGMLIGRAISAGAPIAVCIASAVVARLPIAVVVAMVVIAGIVSSAPVATVVTAIVALVSSIPAIVTTRVCFMLMPPVIT